MENLVERFELLSATLTELSCAVEEIKDRTNAEIEEWTAYLAALEEIRAANKEIK